MSLGQALVCATVFIAGIIIGIVIHSIHVSKKVPWAGNVVIDTRNPNGDTISIESPKNITKWDRYKEIKFTVIALWGDKKRKDK